MSDLDDYSSPKKIKNTKIIASPPVAKTLVDMTTSDEYPSSKPNADIQLLTLKAIKDYNNSLPKARKTKDALEEIAVQNVAATFTIKTDHKKKTKELITNYKQVGIIEGTLSTDADRFNIGNK